MILIDIQTGKNLKGVIEELDIEAINNLKSNKNFEFDWSEESNYRVFQIHLPNETEILGLISILDIASEFRIHINLIESSFKHRGKEKKIENIPGCLISYCCQLAFENGYDGFVSLIPKTQLIKYYHNKYGFIQVGTMMAVFGETSKLIIQKYQGDEKI